MKRTIEQIREHYEIEKELASRLMHSSKKEREFLYASLYNELYRRVPLHPQLTEKKSSELTDISVSSQLVFLKHFLRKNMTFCEIGPGDCSLSLALTKIINKVYAVDVSEEISKVKELPDNFHLILSDGVNIPVPKKSVNLVYSNQLMEHLHPEDAKNQLVNIFNILTDDGKYLCVTPNRINGPHDISKYFDRVATGFHLKEYTFSELRSLFKKVGFMKVQGYWGGRGIFIRTPAFLIILVERLFNYFPFSIKKNRFNTILSIRIVGIK